MTTDATATRHLRAEPESDSFVSRLAQGVRRVRTVTAKGVVDGTRAMWPTLAVVGGLLLVGQLAISYGRSLERQDAVALNQASSEQEQARLAETVARLEGKIDAMQSMLSSLSSVEAKVLTLDKELERMERERRLMEDEISVLRGARP